MPRWEVQRRRRRKTGVDWDALGVPAKVQEYKTIYVQHYIRTEDVSDLEFLSGHETILNWNDGSRWIIRGDYDSLCIQLNDLENSEME